MTEIFIIFAIFASLAVAIVGGLCSCLARHGVDPDGGRALNGGQ